MKEILDASVTLLQQAKLLDIGCNLFAHSYNTRIKTENLEPTIKKEAALHQHVADLEKQTGGSKKGVKQAPGGGESPKK